MAAKRNGTGFSEEKTPFEGSPPPGMLPATPLNARDLFGLGKREEADVGHGLARYDAYYAVLALWLKRKAEGMTQKDIAEKLGRDPAWVSRALGGPANWTLRTLGELAFALNGAVEIKAVPKEDLPQSEDDIYDRFGIAKSRPEGLKEVDRG